MSSPHSPEADDDLELPRRPNPARGGAWTLTVIGLALSSWMLWDMRADLVFWFSTGPVVDLGAPGSYRLDAAQDDVLAKVAGRAGPAGQRFERWGRQYELVAIPGTNLVVQRAAPPGSAPLKEGHRPPGPSQEPFSAEGRLRRDDSVPMFAEAFRFLVERAGAEPREGHLFVLFDEERPRRGWQTPAAALGLLAFFLLNAWTLGRGLVGALRARRG